MTDNGQAAPHYITSSWRSVLQNERKSDSCVIRCCFCCLSVAALDRAGNLANARIVWRQEMKLKASHMHCCWLVLYCKFYNYIETGSSVHIYTFVGSGLNVKHRGSAAADTALLVLVINMQTLIPGAINSFNGDFVVFHFPFLDICKDRCDLNGIKILPVWVELFIYLPFDWRSN